MEPENPFSFQRRKSSPSFLKIGFSFEELKREGKEEERGEDKIVDKIAHLEDRKLVIRI
jgi:hypothetical protein